MSGFDLDVAKKWTPKTKRGTQEKGGAEICTTVPTGRPLFLTAPNGG